MNRTFAVPGDDDHGQDALERLYACSIDQRTYNVRYRQKQLHLLHGFLRQHEEKMCALIAKHSGQSVKDSRLEYSTTLIAINKLYEQLDFDESMDLEYKVSQNKSYIDCRVPHGLVLIKVGTHTVFFSIFSAMAAALAAGNCVIIQLLEQTSALFKFLKDDFQAMNPEIFAIVPSLPESSSSLLSQCFIVEQIDLGQPPDAHGWSAKGPPYTVAIVDRTANPSRAARALCAARFLLKGQSPYAPDLVIVNEWIFDAFAKACQLELAGCSALDDKMLHDALPQAGSTPSRLGEQWFYVMGNWRSLTIF